MRVAVFNQDTGEIRRILNVPPASGHVALNVGAGEDWLAADSGETDATHYVAVPAFTLVAKPARPSSFHDWDLASKTWVPDLSRARADQTADINADCRAKIIGGFISSALGSPRIYDSEETDQANLIGQRERAAITGQAQLYKSRDVATGVKDWRPHTPAQLDQVFLDGAIFKEALLVQATLLKGQIAAANTLDEILVIVWSDPA